MSGVLEPDHTGAATLTEATFTALAPSARAAHRVVWNGREVSIDLSSGGTVTLHGSDFAAPVGFALRSD